MHDGKNFLIFCVAPVKVSRYFELQNRLELIFKRKGLWRSIQRKPSGLSSDLGCVEDAEDSGCDEIQEEVQKHERAPAYIISPVDSPIEGLVRTTRCPR